jgi:hypothetical protein
MRMSARRRIEVVVALAGCLLAVSAYAQELTNPGQDTAPPHLAYIDGAVDVVQDGVSALAEPPMLLLGGDVIRTRTGRGEIVFGDATVLHLSFDSTLEILGDERLRLNAGRVILRVSHAAGRPYVIDTPSSSVRFDSEGEYGVVTDPSGGLEVTVARGLATVAAAQPWSIRGGQRITMAGAGARPLIEPFNSARWDAFAAWSYDRANAFTTAASAAQLPSELRAYSPVFDRYGRWDDVEPYGRVWFPSVGVAWRPYYDGSWAFTRYGWTWRGREFWAWPTHHYGRWGFTGAFWYWVPATVWAPAWVTWSVAPGYVSWAPLGWHTHVPFDAWGRPDHPAYTPRYSPWRGWTVLPRHHFGPRNYVRAHAIDGDRLDDGTRRTLLSQATPLGFMGGAARSGSGRRPPTAGTTAAGPARRVETPSSTTPSSWSDAARDATDRGTQGASDGNGRRGAVRDPGRRATPRSEPSGGQSSSSGKSSGGGSSTRGSSRGDAAGAAARPAGARPKGGGI